MLAKSRTEIATVGTRTDQIDLSITHAIADNDLLRAQKGRRRVEAGPRLEASELQLKELYAQREVAVKEDADEATAAHEQHVKNGTEDVSISRAAEKLAASIDADMDAVVAKFAKLTTMTAPRYES